MWQENSGSGSSGYEPKGYVPGHKDGCKSSCPDHEDGCKRSCHDDSDLEQKNESEIHQGDNTATGGDATANGGDGGDANTGNTQEHNSNASALSKLGFMFPMRVT